MKMANILRWHLGKLMIFMIIILDNMKILFIIDNNYDNFDTTSIKILTVKFLFQSTVRYKRYNFHLCVQ